MAMLSARFHDPAAARQARDMLVDRMGAVPDLVISSPEGPRPGDRESDTSEPTAVPTISAVRVSIYDNAIPKAAAREAFEAAGGIDIRPIQ